MAKTIYRIVLIVVIVAAIVFVLQRMEILPSFKNVFSPQPVVIDKTPVLIKEVKQLGQLITITAFDEVVTDSIKYQQPNKFSMLLQYAVPTAGELKFPKIVIIAKGKVQAGVNLQKLKDQDFFVEKDSIALTLPKAEIFDVIINPSDFTTFSEVGTWQPEEVTLVKSTAKQKIYQRALSQNILDKANVQSRFIMDNFLRTLGYKKITIIDAPN